MSSDHLHQGGHGSMTTPLEDMSLTFRPVGQGRTRDTVFVAAHAIDVGYSLRHPEYHYNTRHSNPSPKPSFNPPPSYSGHFVAPRSRRRWPPLPTVEDEAQALAKELNLYAVFGEISDEVQSRGSVDQLPIILDANASTEDQAWEEQEEDSMANSNDDVFGKLANSRTVLRDNMREGERGRTYALRLETGVDDVPVSTRRNSSPYAFTRPTKFTTNASYDSGIFLSPVSTTPPRLAPLPTKRPSGSYAFVGDPQGKAKQTQGSTPSPRDSGYFGCSHEGGDVGDCELSMKDSDSVGDRRRASGFFFAKSELKDARTSLYDTLDKDGQTNTKVDFLGVENVQNLRRSSDSATTMPRARFDNVRGKSSPLKSPAGGTRDAFGQLYSPFRPPDHGSTVPMDTGAKTASMGTAPPSVLSRTGSNFYENSSPSESRSRPGSKSSSRPNSRPNSGPNSRPASPTSVPDSPAPVTTSTRTSFDPNSRNTTYKLPADRRAGSTSKLAPLTRADSSPAAPRINEPNFAPRRNVTQPLPYPEGDPQLMPSMDDFKINAARLKPSALPKNPAISRVRGPPSPATPVSPLFDSPTSARPRLASRHTLGETVPKSSSRPSSVASSASDVRLDSKPSSSSLTKPLPPCPRTNYSRDYDDWFALEGCPSFDICPKCLADVVSPTKYIKFFKRSSRRPANVQTRCDFGNPWVRLAWLLTLKRQRKDLDLIYALARISSMDAACPGSSAEMRVWHTFHYAYGNTVTNFNVCPCDVKRIEALFPSLRGHFMPAYISSPNDRQRICALRTQSNRFPAYLDLLVDIDSRAAEAGKNPDLRPFVDLVRQKASQRECLRDNFIAGERWHYHPTLPDFTVCEECYADVVQPHGRAGEPLAARFSPTPQRVRGEPELGTSCQLYSPRMRKVWSRAVEKNDLEYLARKVRARREVEVELRKEHMQLMLLRERGRQGVEPEVLRSELQRILDDWRKWE